MARSGVGRLCEVGNGRFVELQCANTWFGWAAGLEKSDGPFWARSCRWGRAASGNQNCYAPFLAANPDRRPTFSRPDPQVTNLKSRRIPLGNSFLAAGAAFN